MRHQYYRLTKMYRVINLPALPGTHEGSIPDELGNLTALQNLRLNFNKIQGESAGENVLLAHHEGLDSTC